MTDQGVKIYTKAGDAGETGLLGADRVPKSHIRVEAYGAVDETNSSIGLVRSLGVPADLDPLLERVQNELFIVGMELAIVPGTNLPNITHLADESIVRLEREIDAWQANLPALRNFILPGGSPAGAALHQARTVCRRAERRIVQLASQESVDELLLRYMNRLSDWLFVLARFVNHQAGKSETIWTGN
jgi:cob(I)alamin adenosyltransferase